jgi:L-methionine (R)-S-oxide reductase
MSRWQECAEQLRAVVADAAGMKDGSAAAAELIRAVMSARWVGIYSVTETEVRNEAWSGPAPPAPPVFAITTGLTGAAVTSRETVVCGDVSADPRYLANQPTTGSEMIVPVIDASGTVCGSLDVESEQTQAFGASERELAEQLAGLLVPLWEH